MFCMHCGKPMAAGATSCPSCGKPRDRAAAAIAAEQIYAGFGRRFVAFIIDRLIIYLPLVVITVALGDAAKEQDALALPLMLGWLAFMMLYNPLMEASPWQATIGKRVMDLKVVTDSGQRIGIVRALVRQFVGFFSGLFLNLGYLIAAFTERRQALHDMAASCLVVRRAYTEQQVRDAGPAVSTPQTLVIVLVCLAAGAVPIIGILAAIAIPAYQDYTMRAKVMAGHQLGREAAALVGEHMVRHDAPPASLEVTGFNGTSAHVSAVTLDAGSGVISVVMKDGIIKDKSLLLIPSRNGNTVTWRCTSDEIRNNLLPMQCRQTESSAAPARLTGLMAKTAPVAKRYRAEFDRIGREYMAAQEAMELGKVLTADRLTFGAGLARNRELMVNMVETAERRIEKESELLGRLRAELAGVLGDNEAARDALAEFDEDLNRRQVLEDRMMRNQRGFAAAVLAVTDFAGARQGSIKVDDGKIVFFTQGDVDRFNELLAALQPLSAEEATINRDRAAQVATFWGKLMPPPPRSPAKPPA